VTAPWEPYQPERLSPEALLDRLRIVADEAREFHRRSMLVWLDSTHADLIDQAADLIEAHLAQGYRELEP
jgi:hypothetical protein